MRDLSARKLETLGDVYKAIDNEEKEFSMDPLFWLKKRIVAIQDYDQHQHFCRELFLLGSSTPRVAEYFNFYNLEIIHAILHSGFQYEYKKFLKWFCRTGTIRELLFEFLYSSEDLLYKYEELQEPQFFQVAK
ncbi:uncharacterized protein LOC135145809 [Zophobas morio]|uniref:uncharacterized protein LOC135145809 n=1 Tax=Zophobas morio TaxID=2755281 RepID=UPI003082C9D9